MVSTAPRRRSNVGGYARGEETRARIIAAALQVFGEEGFDAGSTRKIAARAGVPPPALQYYFDSKEGLHRACAEVIVERVSRALAPALARAEAALADGGAGRARDALCDLMDALFDFSLGSADAATRSRFIGRGQADGAGPALPLIRDQISRPLHAMISRLVAQTTGQRLEDDETRLVAMAVLSPLTAFHINRDNTLAILDWSDFAGERLVRVKKVLRAHTRAALAHSARATPPSTGMVAPTT
ncbi:MAG: CerR family C-terminal domain-containing protein [Caulobacteraceae bacterium]